MPTLDSNEELTNKLIDAITLDKDGNPKFYWHQDQLNNLRTLIKADREAAIREALEPKRIACMGRIACSKCGHETLFEKMHLFPNDIISLNQPTKERE